MVYPFESEPLGFFPTVAAHAHHGSIAASSNVIFIVFIFLVF